MQKEIEISEFVQGVKFKVIDSLKNNSTNYFLNFGYSCERKCSSKAFVDIAAAGRHRGLSTVYFMPKLFHQSKLGRDVEMQNTHIVLFTSPAEVLRVSRLCAQLGLGSKLVDSYQDVPYGYFYLTCRPEQSIVYVIVQTLDPVSKFFFFRTR